MTQKGRDFLSTVGRLCSCTNKNNYTVEDIIHLHDIIKSAVSNEGGVIELGALTYTYGFTTQTSMGGKYAGSQCTTMALVALIFYQLYGQFSPKGINLILKEGHRLHAYLRDTVKLSEEKDNRIAIEELPQTFLEVGRVFGTCITFRMKGSFENVFTTKPIGFERFTTIRQYLEKRVGNERAGFLITLDIFSYAIILREPGTALLFDSHGHLRLKGHGIKNRAGALAFPSIQRLDGFLFEMYGPYTQAVISEIALLHLTKRMGRATTNKLYGCYQYTPYITEEPMLKRTKRTDNKRRVLKSYRRVETEPANDVLIGGEGDVMTGEKSEDISPYVALMGGF